MVHNTISIHFSLPSHGSSKACTFEDIVNIIKTNAEHKLIFNEDLLFKPDTREEINLDITNIKYS